jgi:uncharacterized protein (DUF433 family)
VFDRIVTDPEILGGKPCIRGTRLSVEFLLDLFAQGAGRTDVLAAYPHLEDEDIEQALRYAARILGNEIVIAAELKG